MNRNKRRYMRCMTKSAKYSTRAEYWAWKAKFAHSAEIEDAVEQTLADVVEFAICSSDTPGTPIDHFTGRRLPEGTDGED